MAFYDHPEYISFGKILKFCRGSVGGIKIIFIPDFVVGSSDLCKHFYWIVSNGELQSHKGVTLGLPGVTLGHPGARQGHIWVSLGQPRVSLGRPGVSLSHPGVTLGHSVVNLGHPGVNPGHPGVTLGHPWVTQGFKWVAQWSWWVTLGHPGSATGYPGIPGGNHGSPRGNLQILLLEVWYIKINYIKLYNTYYFLGNTNFEVYTYYECARVSLTLWIFLNVMSV